MKKIFLTLFILLSAFLFFPLSVLAQNKDLRITLPGLNCGIAENPQKNQCCIELYPSKFIPPDPGPMSVLLSPFKFYFQYQIDSYLQPLINKFSSFTKKTLPCETGIASTSDLNDPNCKCINPIITQPANLSALNAFCQRQEKIEDRSKCLNCANGGGVFSGIGCIKTDTKTFIKETVFGLGIGLGGGFSLLCIIYAAFMMQSSQGNPEKLKKAQEMITSCIMGLMLIIFSVFILKLIGVDILRIPEFRSLN